jgi:Bacteriophage T4-like portal protein (Gp20)/Phage portal protein, lambda family
LSNFTGFWKIVTPKTRKQLYTTLSSDSYDPRSTDQSSLAAVSWYSQIMKGPGSRMTSYKQYDTMDADIDISRSLDIIAEEMSDKDSKTDLPFLIKWQKEDNQDISDTTSVTVRAALRQWSELQDLKKRIFSTSRCLVKYGDCFFRKVSDTRKWIYIDPSLVSGIEIDEVGNKIAYHVRRPHNASPAQYGMNKNEQLDIIPAAAMIHFSMCDDMGDSAPFGSSVLRPIFRVYRQLSMLEDAVIIYRIVRAPERRVFYIDTGNMNQQQVKRYLESIKNEIRQKRVPGSQTNGVKDTVDGQYDPQCLTLDTRIPLLDGRTLSLNELIEEHSNGKQNWVYSCNPITGEIKPGEIEWAGLTRKNAQLVKITLDNKITCSLF